MRGQSGRWSRNLAIGVAVGALVVAAVAGWFLIAPSRDSPDSGDVDDPFTLAVVERGSLRVGVNLPGRLGYGSPKPLPIQVSGIVTWLPDEGARASQGQALMRVDNRPVVLMYGTTPAYRVIDAGEKLPEPQRPPGRPGRQSQPEPASDTVPGPGRPPAVGPDVEQLERGLAALGYTGFTVDEEFTDRTAAAVRAWQEDLGVPPTGRVELGDVLFLPRAIRLHPNADALGRAASETSVQQTGTTRYVAVETEDAGWAESGVRVRVTLPNQRTVKGRVVAVASSGAGESEMGGGFHEVRVVLDSPHAKAPVGPVTVQYVSARRRDVLTVPVTALVALAEGGYAVELADGRLIGVETGLYADGSVEVSGDLEAGMEVRVPS